MRFLLILLLAGCAYNWHADEAMKGQPRVIETQDASVICSQAMGQMARACAITFAELDRCIVLILPGDRWAEVHERRHCTGQQHEDRK